MPQDDRDTSSSSPSNAEDAASVLRLGLIPAPELPERIAYLIVDELPALLKQHTDERHDWKVEYVTDALVGAAEQAADVVDQAERLKRDNDWDYVVCLTDLPLYRDGQLTVAEASENRGVSTISQPALGASPLKRRLREAILHLVNEMHHGSSDDERERQQQHMESDAEARDRSGLRNQSSRHLMGWGLAERLAPIERQTPEHGNEDGIDVRFVSATHWRGHAKLLGGMIRANRPWTIVPAFRRIIAVAFATGAYGLISPGVWKLSAAYDPFRFIALMVAAIVAMVIWLILDHGLWESRSDSGEHRLRRLYNMTTALTLALGVSCYYLILFVLFLVAVTLFIPPSLLGSTVGESVGWLHFVALAWLSTSIGTVAGALGSSLESDETVRGATYGYRQQLRNRKVRERQADDDDGNQDSRDPGQDSQSS